MKVICIDDVDAFGIRSQFYTKWRWYEVVSSPSDLDRHMIYIRDKRITELGVDK